MLEIIPLCVALLLLLLCESQRLKEILFEVSNSSEKSDTFSCLIQLSDIRFDLNSNACNFV
jgi:hypothetical protein